MNIFSSQNQYWTEVVAVEVVLGVDSLGLIEPDRATEHRQGRIARFVHADAHEHHHTERDKEEDDDELQYPLKEITHVNLVDRCGSQVRGGSVTRLTHPGMLFIRYCSSQSALTQNWPLKPAPSRALVPSGIVVSPRPCRLGMCGVPHSVQPVGIW